MTPQERTQFQNTVQRMKTLGLTPLEAIGAAQAIHNATEATQ